MEKEEISKSNKIRDCTEYIRPRSLPPAASDDHQTPYGRVSSASDSCHHFQRRPFTPSLDSLATSRRHSEIFCDQHKFFRSLNHPGKDTKLNRESKSLYANKIQTHRYDQISIRTDTEGIRPYSGNYEEQIRHTYMETGSNNSRRSYHHKEPWNLDTLSTVKQNTGDEHLYMELQSRRQIPHDIVSANYPSIDNEEWSKLCDEFSGSSNQPNKAEAPSEDPSSESIINKEDLRSFNSVVDSTTTFDSIEPVDRVEYLKNLHQGLAKEQNYLIFEGQLPVIVGYINSTSERDKETKNSSDKELRE